MADVRLLVQEEGRTARNLVAFNVPAGTQNSERVTKKPPSVPRNSGQTLVPNSKRSMKPNTRVRSASTGRDKKSEMHARYWAFLFGNLQRAVDGIYQTCEEDENISECKEVILVLENYTRDFHNLIEWFRVKWAYENSPPPLRRTPLAWEVRKTSPCRIYPAVNSQDSQQTSPHPLQKIFSTGSILPAKSETQGRSEDFLSQIKGGEEKKKKDNEAESGKKKETQVANNKERSNKSMEAANQSSVKRPVPGKIVNENPRKEWKQQNSIRNLKSVQTGGNSCVRKVLENKSKEKAGSEVVENCGDRSIMEIDKDTKSEKSVKNNGNSRVEKQKEEEIRNKKNGIEKDSDKKLDITPKGRKETSNIKIMSEVSAINGTSRLRPKSSNLTRAQPTRNFYERKMIRNKTTLGIESLRSESKAKAARSSVYSRHPGSESRDDSFKERLQYSQVSRVTKDGSALAEVSKKELEKPARTREESDGWQIVRNRCRRGSTHNLNMSTRFHKPSIATSLPTLCLESSKKNDGSDQHSSRNAEKSGKNDNSKTVDPLLRKSFNQVLKMNGSSSTGSNSLVADLTNTNSTNMIAAVFKNEAELLEKRIQQFMSAQAERERIILEEERKTEEADSKRSQQLCDEEAFLQKQIQELESTEIDVDTETDETDGENVLEIEDDDSINEIVDVVVVDDISLEDRYENMLEGMSWAERMDTLAQLQALVARHPGRALELHQKLSSPSRKRSLPETLRRYQAKQACAQRKRQHLLMEKSQRLRELLNKVEDVKSAKTQLIEDKRIRMELKLKRAEENRTQHLMEIVRKAHDEESKLKEIAFINELEAQNKRHDFMALCQEQEERLQGIQEERQRRQEEKAAKEAAAEERRRLLEKERQLRIQKMRQAQREREERVGKMQLEREKERQELAREKARDREERLSALHAAQLANQEELQKKIAQKQQESARRHVESIEQIRQRAVESSILRSEEVPPTLRSYPGPKQCSLCETIITNEVCLLSHLKGKLHLANVRKTHDGREPSRDELARFNIAQIRDIRENAENGIQEKESKARKEKQKALKRKSRKVKQRMASRGQEWEDQAKAEPNSGAIESANKSKFRRNLKELEKFSNARTSASSFAATSLERCLGEISRAFSKSCRLDQDTFKSLGGIDTLTNLLRMALHSQNSSVALPYKCVVALCRVYRQCVDGHACNCETVLLSNKILVLLDLLLQQLDELANLEDHVQAQEVIRGNLGGALAAATGTVQLLCSLIPDAPFDKASLQSRIQDVTGYLVMGGMIDRIAGHSRALIETDFYVDQECENPFLIASCELLSKICRQTRKAETSAPTDAPSEHNATRSHFLADLMSTEVAGMIGTLYAALTLTSQNQKGSSPTPNQIGQALRLLVLRALELLRVIAESDLQKVQSLLGAEGTNLQWRLIASQLITKLSREPPSLDKPEADPGLATNGSRILTELFIVLGYFAVNNPENQVVLQSAGPGLSVLQQLCTLPFPFYGDPRLSASTLSALLAATHGNPEAIAILSCELSYQLLEEYRNSEEGRANPIVKLLIAGSTTT